MRVWTTAAPPEIVPSHRPIDGSDELVHYHLRHQELRHDEEGAGLARQARRRLCLPRLQDRRHRTRTARKWCKKVGWEALLNRAGTTFRKLPDTTRTADAKKALALMLAQPSMIKRPVLDLGAGKLLVGFKPEIYSEALAKA